VLNSDQIQALGLIENALDSSYRTTSYDLTIGEVIDPAGNSVGFHRLEPQQMVVVISGEKVRLPRTVSGYAMPKTSLCNEGILALSTGIMDPGYEGLVSSMLVNFGGKAFALEEGNPYLRLTFHEIVEPKNFVLPPNRADADYRRDKMKLGRSLPDTFLDLPHIINKVATEALSIQLNRSAQLLAWIGLIFVGLTLLLSIVVFLGAPFVDRLTNDGLEDRIARDVESQNVEPLREQIRTLEDRIRVLEAQRTP
jgi:dUTPase